MEIKSSVNSSGHTEFSVEDGYEDALCLLMYAIQEADMFKPVAVYQEGYEARFFANVGLAEDFFRNHPSFKSNSIVCAPTIIEEYVTKDEESGISTAGDDK